MAGPTAEIMPDGAEALVAAEAVAASVAAEHDCCELCAGVSRAGARRGVPREVV